MAGTGKFCDARCNFRPGWDLGGHGRRSARRGECGARAAGAAAALSRAGPELCRTRRALDDPAAEGTPLLAQWEGFLPALGVALAFGVLGPLLYGVYFSLGENARRKAFLLTSIVANLGVLAFFKYFNSKRY